MKRRGFTLVEVLLALAIFAALSLFVFGVVRAVLGLWQSGERRGRGDLEFAAALGRLRSDLGALHTGSRGWLELDWYEAAPAVGAEPAWRLPRLRFLARGDALPGDDGSGRAAVEVAWLLVPDALAPGGRLARLVRLAQVESPSLSLADDGDLAGQLRAGRGDTVLDGIARAEFRLLEADGSVRSEASIAPRQPYGFPPELELRLERVAGDLRQLPPRLDEDLGDGSTRLVLRGSAPARLAEYALIEREWLRVGGQFPLLSAIERGARDSLPSAHPRGAPVWLPEGFSGRAALSAGGRRLP